MVWLSACGTAGAGERAGHGEAGPSGAAVRPAGAGGDAGQTGAAQRQADPANKVHQTAVLQ